LNQEITKELQAENPKPKLENRFSRPWARPLAPVVVALVAGVASPAWGLRLPEAWLAVGLFSLWAGLALAFRLRRRVRIVPLAFFWLLGVALCQQALNPALPPHHLVRLPQNEKINILGSLNRSGKVGEGRVQLFLAPEAWLAPAGWRPATGNLLVSAPKLDLPPVGTPLVVQGRLRAPRTVKNPGAFDRPRYLAADGIFQEMRLGEQARPVFLAAAEGHPWKEKLRGGIRILLKPLDPAVRAMYLALLLGDQGEITPEMRTQFARTGTSHLLAISGLHLGMVAAVVYFLSFWLLRRSAWVLLRVNAMKAATLVAVFPVVAYAWMVGGSPSTQRAEVMVLAYLLLVFLGRPREVWSALALAALVILAWSPLRLFSISFQLSFAAVAALIYLLPRLTKAVVPEEGDRTPGSGARLVLWGKKWLVRGKEWLAASAVATLATAPLVAAYFQVVSLLGILVNLAAIPLVLGLALPLGEAAVLAQALQLTPLAQVLVSLGRIPLWLGYQAIAWGAKVPGSALTVPIPSWPQIVAYYLVLVLVFAPRRSYLTWSGAALAAVFLVGSAVAPLADTPRCLEVTCLDGRGLAGVAVTPEGRRLVFSAAEPSWPGREGGGGPGALPVYCHWRQFRTLDLVAALYLSQDNAGEMLALAQQFQVGSFWYGRRGREGPASWDLGNYLGDRGASPRSLLRGGPPKRLGEVEMAFVAVGEDEDVALQLIWQGRRVLIVPPLRRLSGDLPGSGAAGRLDLLVLPASLAASREEAQHRGREGPDLLARLSPRRLIVYGGREGENLGYKLEPPHHFTREGALSVYLCPDQVRVRQW
jgi:competence protein ComEC